VADWAASPGAHVAFLQPPLWRPFTELLAGIPHLLVIKWFIPGGVEVDGDGGLASVEKIKGFIAFSIFGLGSFLHISRTMLYF
jgi:hypothetical protein